MPYSCKRHFEINRIWTGVFHLRSAGPTIGGEGEGFRLHIEGVSVAGRASEAAIRRAFQHHLDEEKPLRRDSGETIPVNRSSNDAVTDTLDSKPL